MTAFAFPVELRDRLMENPPDGPAVYRAPPASVPFSLPCSWSPR